MSFFSFSRAGLRAVVITLLFALAALSSLGQSRPQKVEKPTGDGKKNDRPKPMTEEERKKAEQEKAEAEAAKNAIIDPNIEKIESNIVNVDAVVINKKTGQIISGLKKANFAIFENGVKQEITNFA